MSQRYAPTLRATGMALAAGLTVPVSHAKPPAAGTDISNTASVTYINSNLGLRETINSNSVLTRIGEVPAIAVSADQSFARAPGDNALFAFQIENTGNVPVAVGADFGAFGGDFNFTRAVAYIDVNEDGHIDSGDQRLTSSDELDLAVGEQTGVLVDINVPASAIAGTSAFGFLQALIIDADAGLTSTGSSLSGNATASTVGVDNPVEARGEVVIIDRAASLQKFATVTDNTSGGEIIYTLNLRNNSPEPIEPFAVFDNVPLTLDGVAQNLLLVRDEIPLNTDFKRIVDAVNFDPVFHRRGDAPETWTRNQPTDTTEIDAVGFVTDTALPASESLDFQFAVEIAENSGGSSILNTAEFFLPAGDGSSLLTSSNLVSTQIEGEGGSISYFGSPQFEDPISELPFDERLFVEVASGACNVSANIDVAEVTLTTLPGGDLETFLATETAENSGVFRISDIPVADASTVLQNDGVLQGERRSNIEASVECDPLISGGITLSPAGAVFLSSTNEPIPGALVELLDQSGAVLDQTTTDAEGFYEILPEAAGAHTIRVTPQGDLVAPSQRQNFIGFGRNVLADASFGEPFVINAASTLDVDVPVDPNLGAALRLAISADRREAQLGDVIQYTIEVQNTASISVQATEIFNDLPRGLELIGGSVLLDGGPLADPQINGIGQLVFPLGLLQPNEKVSVTYVARILPTAGRGDKVNHAIAEGSLVGFGSTVASNTDSVTVVINDESGVFSREGVILGKVFLDCDANGVQNGPYEHGIPGVQLYTQEGLSVITDHAGRYSLSQLDPRTHVLDVRESTLPSDTQVRNTHALDGLRGGSRFVSLRTGDIRTENFAVSGCGEDVLANIKERLEKLNARVENSGLADGLAGRQIAFDKTARGTDTVHASAPNTGLSGNPSDTSGQETGPYSHEPRQAVDAIPLKELLATASDGLHFVDLVDQDQTIHRNLSLRLTAPANLVLDLTLNGEPVSDDRIGQRVADASSQALEFIALPLQAGDNEFVLTGRDGFGNARATETVTITAPGDPSRVLLLAPETAVSDPAKPIPIRLQVVDAEGRPAAALIEATLRASEDQFDVRDTSEQIPGLQTLIEDGSAELDLIPSGLVGTRTLRIDTPFGPSEAKIRFTPALDGDRIAVGYIEGALGISENGTSSLPDIFGRDEISPFEDTEEGVEGAVFLKGRLFGNSLLTFRHDSARDVDDGLFRSVEPDEFYPVYGDQSQRGFDARSRGKTFGKIEYGSSYALFGDVSFDAASQVLQLGTFQRTLEGAKAHLEAGRLSVDLYAGQTDTGQIIVELPALGISGPYELDIADVVENSETVELITRDRDQPGVIIRTERLGRFSDYTLDFFSRTLIFNRPIASRDADLNPVAIRVTFETDPGAGEDYWLFGGEAAFALNDWLSVGYRQLTSDGAEGSDDDQTVRAAYVAANIGTGGRLEIEAAESIDPLDRSGTGIRVGYEQQTARGAFGARLATTTNDFNAPGAGVNAGRDEARVFGNQRLGPGTLTGEGIYTAEQDSEAERFGIVARYETVISDTLRARAGGRFVDDTNASGAREDAFTVIAGLGWSPKIVDGLTVDLEAEQEVTDGTQSRFALGADYALTPKARLYVQGEYSGSRSGSFGLADTFNDDVTLRIGGEYRWTDKVTAFSEYRSNDGFFDSGVANGLSVGWSVSPSLNLRTRVEHVQPVGEQFRRNTSASFGATWEPENRSSILDGDLEYAAGEGGQRSWFFSASAGQRWKDITLLARNRYARTESAGERRERDRLRAGGAYRPKNNNRLNALAWYEYETDRTDLLDEQRHIWSLGGEWQPGSNLRWRNRIAGQRLIIDGQVFNETSTTLLVQSGAELDVHQRINLALNASLIGDSQLDNVVWGVGGEMNFALVENFLIGVGYNYSEVEEERFERLNRSGFFVRLRAKFDQNIWNIFDDLG
ncbi:MAG: hypothetical protein ABJG15_10610 [Hyphomonadaceae bacterium]